jgi:hypothetical protein
VKGGGRGPKAGWRKGEEGGEGRKAQRRRKKGRRREEYGRNAGINRAVMRKEGKF